MKVISKEKILSYVADVANKCHTCNDQNYYEAIVRQFDVLMQYWKSLNIEDDNWSVPLNDEIFDEILCDIVDAIMNWEENMPNEWIGKERQYVKSMAIACHGCYQLLQKIRAFSRHESIDSREGEFNDLSLLEDEELLQIVDVTNKYVNGK